MHSSAIFARRAMIYLALLTAVVQVPMSSCESSTSLPRRQECKEHQKRVEQFQSMPGYVQSLSTAYKKYQNNTLQLNDVLSLYTPQCDEATGLYLSKQCSPVPKYCWCSTPEGQPIDGTAQFNMPTDYCSGIKDEICVVDGKTYRDGEIFTQAGICGQCECSAGTHSCYLNFTLDKETGNLSDLDSFKVHLVQMFTLLCNSSDEDIDIRPALKTPSASDDVTKEAILRWKFNDYNRNHDSFLSAVEEFVFRTNIFKYFGCSQLFFDQLNLLIDTNGNSQISLEEWLTFFGVDTPVTNTSGDLSSEEYSPTVVNVAYCTSGEQKPEKREARRFARKPLHLRKKFHFVYSDDIEH